MLELLISVCLIDTPDRCKDVAVTYAAENTSPFQCMMGALPEVAKWSETHPKWVVKRWTCQPAGRFAKL